MKSPAGSRTSSRHISTRVLFLNFVFVVTALLLIGTKAFALPPGFSFNTIASGLNQGVGFAFAPGDLVYIAEKGGRVRVVDGGSLQSAPFLDISAQVNGSRDRGLLGIAVDPDFPAKPWIYLLYTYDPPELAALGLTGRAAPDGAGNRVSRLIRVRANQADGYRTAVAGSEELLLGSNSTYQNIGEADGGPTATTPSCNDWGRNQPSGAPVVDCIPIDEESHTIGALRFLPDRSLLVSSGDGASYRAVSQYALRAQNLDSLAGKILRIDPDTGRGLADNPYVVGGNTTSNRSRVYSYGLRNPFRFTLHYSTNDPVIGDVGWREWEEANFGGAKNFGWPCYEGANGVNAVLTDYQNFDVCQTLYSNSATVEAPFFSYNHNGLGASIQMGDYSVNNNYPSAYDGALFVSDYNRGVVETLTAGAGGNITAQTFETSISGITQITRAPNNKLWFINIIFGTLQELEYTSNNQAPVAAFSVGTPTGPGLLNVPVDASASSDPDQDSLTYSWTFGDGGTGTGVTTSHAYASPGTRTITLTVTDPSGASDSTTESVTVGNSPPIPSIEIPGNPDYAAGDIVNYTGSATDAEDGTISGAGLSWSAVLFHNQHQHPDYYAATGSSGSFEYEDHGDNTYVQLCLTATDSAGSSTTLCTNLGPKVVTYTLDSSPAGVTLSFSGLSGPAPFTVTTIVGGQRSVTAPATTTGGNPFTSWSDGGSLTHNITIEDTDQTLVASYSTGNQNQAPKVFWPGNRFEDVGGSVSFTMSAEDPDGDALLFTATNLPPDVEIDQNTGTISGDLTQAGGYGVTVTVVDGNGGSDDTSFWWRVRQSSSNAVPKVYWPGDRFDEVGDSMSFTLRAEDADGDTLTFSATGLPSGVEIDSATGVISGQVDEASGNPFTITVSDGQGGTDTTSMWWRVWPSNQSNE